MTLITVVIGYLVMGLLALAVLDLTTKRIRSKLRGASYETQTVVANTNTGTYLGNKLAIVVILTALWIFWPAVIWGAVESRIRRKENEK